VCALAKGASDLLLEAREHRLNSYFGGETVKKEMTTREMKQTTTRPSRPIRKKEQRTVTM